MENGVLHRCKVVLVDINGYKGVWTFDCSAGRERIHVIIDRDAWTDTRELSSMVVGPLERQLVPRHGTDGHWSQSGDSTISVGIAHMFKHSQACTHLVMV